MADPILDEALVLAYLTLPATTMTVDRIQQGAMLALVDCWDRKLLRERFIDIATTCMTLKDSLARQSIMYSLDDTFRAGELTQEKLDSAINGLDRTVERNRMNLLQMMEQVAACPTKQDSVS